MQANGVDRAAGKAARESYGKLIAVLARQAGDVAAAEDALSEAFAAALATWPQTGVPGNPEAWLLTVARRKNLDAKRRAAVAAQGVPVLALLQDERLEGLDQDRPVPDRRLELIFACAHPAVDEAARTALMLQAVLGLTAREIASAFLVSPSAMGQRLARAKAKILLAGIPFRIPPAEQLPERLPYVLDAVYAAFSLGWQAREGGLAGEAIWLARILRALMPGEAEVAGLLALMLFLEARKPAQHGPDRDFVPLAEQDVRLWDEGAIGEAEDLLRASWEIGRPGRFQVEAAIQSAHAARRLTGRTDWDAVLVLYDDLVARTGSPVVALNRAVALAEVRGAAAGLEALADIGDREEFLAFQPWWAVQADLLARDGQSEAAFAAYTQAIGLSEDQSQREFLMNRRAGLAIQSATPSTSGTKRTSQIS